jgi:hypothetical protein
MMSLQQWRAEDLLPFRAGTATTLTSTISVNSAAMCFSPAKDRLLVAWTGVCDGGNEYDSAHTIATSSFLWVVAGTAE